jgi:hypothetical protein
MQKKPICGKLDQLFDLVLRGRRERKLTIGQVADTPPASLT